MMKYSVGVPCRIPDAGSGRDEYIPATPVVCKKVGVMYGQLPGFTAHGFNASTGRRAANAKGN